ncbi:hypothetical protein V493_00776 [Pseudogymnoascus sp. VKM F-4281 (FW-2241)]|nr:hypothetical protein V493_00776 [Pseudogymnoascus sp. VKM F-4281 (FW-2241)]
MTASIIPTDPAHESHTDAQGSEKEDFITARPRKSGNAISKPHKKAPTQAERESMFPAMDPTTIPEERWLDVPSILAIGRDLARAPKKPKGQVFGKTAGYLRHCAALYAFTYRGHLRPAYWPYRHMKDKHGERILTEERGLILCLGMSRAHEELPYTINSKGLVYKRAHEDFLRERTKTGQFTSRPNGVPPIMHTFSQVQGLAAAVEGVNNEFDLRKITGKELGTQRLQHARKQTLDLAAQSIVEQGRALRAQQQVPALVTQEGKRLAAVATKEKDELIEKLEECVRMGVETSKKEIDELVEAYEEIIEGLSRDALSSALEIKTLKAQFQMDDEVPKDGQNCYGEGAETEF